MRRNAIGRSRGSDVALAAATLVTLFGIAAALLAGCGDSISGIGQMRVPCGEGTSCEPGFVCTPDLRCVRLPDGGRWPCGEGMSCDPGFFCTADLRCVRLAGDGGSATGGAGGDAGDGGGVSPTDGNADVPQDAPAVDAVGSCGSDDQCPTSAPMCLNLMCARCTGPSDCAGHGDADASIVRGAQKRPKKAIVSLA
jgi:hypothetical protein